MPDCGPCRKHGLRRDMEEPLADAKSLHSTLIFVLLQMEHAGTLQYLFSGLTSGAIYAVIALGFTMLYNATGLINFAQGEFVMLEP